MIFSKMVDTCVNGGLVRATYVLCGWLKFCWTMFIISSNSELISWSSASLSFERITSLPSRIHASSAIGSSGNSAGLRYLSWKAESDIKIMSNLVRVLPSSSVVSSEYSPLIDSSSDAIWNRTNCSQFLKSVMC